MAALRENNRSDISSVINPTIGHNSLQDWAGEAIRAVRDYADGIQREVEGRMDAIVAIIKYGQALAEGRKVDKLITNLVNGLK